VAQSAKPNLLEWLAEVKRGPKAAGIGMLLTHNGIVRGTSRSGEPVVGMKLSYDHDKLQRALESARGRQGIAEIRGWVNEGDLEVGDDIMYVLVAGDIRENVFGALQDLVREIKTSVVTEQEFKTASL
jgi:molybdopterin synthase catalytic subunit